MYIYIYTYVFKYMYICICSLMYLSMCVSSCMHTCMHKRYVWICMCHACVIVCHHLSLSRNQLFLKAFLFQYIYIYIYTCSRITKPSYLTTKYIDHQTCFSSRRLVSNQLEELCLCRGQQHYHWNHIGSMSYVERQIVYRD